MEKKRFCLFVLLLCLLLTSGRVAFKVVGGVEYSFLGWQNAGQSADPLASKARPTHTAPGGKLSVCALSSGGFGFSFQLGKGGGRLVLPGEIQAWFFFWPPCRCCLPTGGALMGREMQRAALLAEESCRVHLVNV